MRKSKPEQGLGGGIDGDLYNFQGNQGRYSVIGIL